MSTNETPKINEKVRFWEEQDKINQAIIPRVVEMHEVIREMHRNTANISSQIAASEARAVQRAKEHIAEDVASVVVDLKRLSDTVHDVQARLDDVRADTTQQAAQVGAHDQLVRANLISYASVSIALIALAVSLFSLIG